jgi:hypothetical protein
VLENLALGGRIVNTSFRLRKGETQTENGCMASDHQDHNVSADMMLLARVQRIGIIVLFIVIALLFVEGTRFNLQWTYPFR